jgi:AcrR family transcriptional regulator
MREATKDAISAAAAKLFAEKGCAATRIEEIAELAGVSVGLIYQHYKSKDDLFASLIEGASIGLEKLAGSIQSGGDPKEIIEKIAEEIHMDLQRPDFVSLMMLITQGLLARDESICKSIIRSDLSLLSSVSKLIERGQELGEFGDGDPYEMSLLFFSNVQGLAIMSSSLGEEFKMPSVKLFTASFYRGLGK